MALLSRKKRSRQSETPPTPSVSAESPAQDVVAGQVQEPVVQLATQLVDKTEKLMIQETDDFGSEQAMETMLEYSEDIASAEAPNPLPARDYIGEVRSVKKAISKTSGKTYFDIGLYIDPAQYPVDYTDGNPDGTVLHYRRLLYEDTPQGRYNMRRMCETLNVPMSTRINLAEWIGKKAKVTVTHETYEGLPRHQADRLSRI